MDLNIFSTEFNFDSPWMIGGWIGIQFEKKTNLSDTLRTRGTQTMLGNSIYMWFTWWYSFYEKSICIGQLSVWTKNQTFGWEVFILSWYMLTIWQSWIRCHINVCISWPPLTLSNFFKIKITEDISMLHKYTQPNFLLQYWLIYMFKITNEN